MSQGHQANELGNYSFDKLKLYYSTSRRRVEAERLRAELKFLQLIAIGSNIRTKKAADHYRKTETAMMEDLAKLVAKDQQAALIEGMAMKLQAAGVKPR